MHVIGGPFLMGGTVHDDERPERLVVVKGFWLDRTEVAAASYDACVERGDCTAAQNAVGCTGSCGSRTSDPINCVDYAQATAFCAWRGGRLPTEAEWEYAAKGGGEQRTYSWGEAEPGAQLCWRRRLEEGTCAVASFAADASRDGALDLAGGVREWTSSPYYASPPSSESAKTRAIRGASWDAEDATWARAAYRSSQQPETWGQSLGIRCAYDVAPPDEIDADD